ncbi:putative PGG domain-containing protein [Rosa chinensis]|uniref:Putative PGG domain-containing protein n=2 Tax=Rosa chinensis TaxID=74649 RepID=A0A2P6PHI5_ROSCH|nr:putative PGG domain-containing protein [Rosa chinensis]
MKSNHFRFDNFLSCMVQVTKSLDNFTPAEFNVVRNSLFKAIERGHVEFVTHMQKANPAVMEIFDDKNNIFQYAIEYRQEKIYSSIYKLKSKKRDDIMHSIAKFNNNMLHSAANLSPVTHYNHIQGASLQMQRELQWFKEVESLLPIEMHEFVNTSNLTARELFTKNHKKLKEEAEASMKGTAASCTTIGALIVTMMFAVAFTVPGATDGNTGLPIFMHKKLFKIFIISDTISLVSSTTSVITFLGLLTSTYAEDDFLWSLPTKMMIGLSSLFVSIAAMMITFSCALTIMLDGEAKMIIMGIVFASVPVGSFICFLFPLLFEICMSTYGPSMFDRKTNVGIEH